MDLKLFAVIIYTLYRLSHMFMFVAFGLFVSSLVLMLKDLLSTHRQIQHVKSVRRVSARRGLRYAVLGYALSALTATLIIYFGHILVKHIVEWVLTRNIVALLAIQTVIYGSVALALSLLSRGESKRVRIASALAVTACAIVIASGLIQLSISTLAKNIVVELVR